MDKAQLKHFSPGKNSSLAKTIIKKLPNKFTSNEVLQEMNKRRGLSPEYSSSHVSGVISKMKKMQMIDHVGFEKPTKCPGLGLKVYVKKDLYKENGGTSAKT